MDTTFIRAAETDEDVGEGVEDAEGDGVTTTTTTTPATTTVINSPTIHLPNSTKTHMHTITTIKVGINKLNNTSNALQILANTTKTCGIATLAALMWITRDKTAPTVAHIINSGSLESRLGSL